MPLLPVLVILLAGIGLAVQAPTNAALARAGGSVTLAALTSFVIGTAALAIAWLAVDRTAPAAMKGAPGWAWAGGLYGACFVAAMAYATPRLGLAVTLTLAIASQLVAALLLDHWGLLGLRQTPVSPVRIAGVLLVLGGVLLLRRG
jgi:bacterial/archaeal transporter family-2 protein